MKKLIKSILILSSVVFLAGCGSKGSQTNTSVPKPVAEQPVSPIASSSSQNALPSTVSTQPGANVDQEVNNITKDLNAASADDFNSTGLSDKNLGL